MEAVSFGFNVQSMVFCLPRSNYKSAAGQYLLDKLDAQLGESLRDDPDYKKYMGAFFWLWAIIHA